MAWSYASPTVLLEAVALLLLFAKLDVENERLKKLIGIVAPSTFIVYVVHSNEIFRRITGWKICFHWLIAGGELGVVLGTIVLAVAIFACVTFVDLVRRMIVKICQGA